MSQVLESFVGAGEFSKWAAFFLNGEMFALRVEEVQEVLLRQPLTPVPLAPEYVVGLLNLRGQIIPAVDLRRRLHFTPRDPDTPYSILVLNGSEEGVLSLVVDEIGDVLALPTADWREPPDTLAERHRGFLFGICPIEKHVVLGLKVAGLSGDVDVARQAA